jgi:hypothetical protein
MTTTRSQPTRPIGRRPHRRRWPPYVTWALALALAGGASNLGCGQTSGKILERLDGGVFAGSSPRVDVFLLRSVATCAVGRACTAADPSQCFYVADAAGPRTSFSTDGLRFVRPGDPLTQTADRVECFKLVLDDDAAASAREMMANLRTSVFQASEGNIDLDVHIREVPSLEGGFIRFYTGLFLPPETLAPTGLSFVSRGTDFVYALSGFRDAETTLQPKMEYCAGTNWLAQGVLGASPYTWMGLNDRCRRPETLLGTFLLQVYLVMRDLNGAVTPRDYPACGRADRDPQQWFPATNDCTVDPDAPACGQQSCPDPMAFYEHVLREHWPRSAPYNGNYCADGRQDFDETDIDSGGVCDLIGR